MFVAVATEPTGLGLASLLVHGVTTIARAVLFHFQTLAVVDLGLHRDVVTLFALCAFESNFHSFVALGHDAAPSLKLQSVT